MLETRIDAVDFLAQLDEEVVMAYDVTDETITNIVIALLAMQIHTTPITLGTIEPVVTRSILIEDQQDSILGVISKLRDTVGGYIEVDTDRKLNWWNDIGEDKGQQIRYKKNVKGLSRTLEYTNFGNRLYCYGAGEGTARIHLSQAIGMTVDYVESVPSQGIYGMCIRQLTDKSITDPDVLLAWALLKLDEMKDPRHSYTVDMVNLAAMGWTFEALQLGSYVKVIDEDMGIDIDARIVKIKRDLVDTQNIQVEISNPGKDIIDTMGGVYDNQQFQDHIATKIGAGQVIVLGDFSVIDWVTGGTTNIKGDYVRTGHLESTNWGVGTGSQFDLDAGTFKLGGSAAPKLSWDGSTLIVSGTIYATAGEFTGTLKTSNIEAGKALTVLGNIIAGGGNVKISPTGINIFGLANALTTRVTEAGTIQCSVDANGKITAGAGAVYMDSDGLHIVCSGTTDTWFHIYNGDDDSYIRQTSGILPSLQITSERKIILYPTGSGIDGNIYLLTSGSNNILPSASGEIYLGSASIHFNTMYAHTFSVVSPMKMKFADPIDCIKKIRTKSVKGGEVIDKDTLPSNIVTKITQKEKDEYEACFAMLTEAYEGEKKLGHRVEKPQRHELGESSISLNDLIGLLYSGMQDVIERIEVLEAA